MKRRLLLFLGIGLLLFTVACGGSNSNDKDTNNSNKNSNGDTNTITAWAWDQVFNVTALETAGEYYDGDEEFELKVIENAQDDIIQKLNAGLSSGTTSGLPNIVLIEDYRAQSFLQAYPDAFFALDDYFDVDDFADYKIETTSYDGKQYGVPFDTGVSGLYVRTDYLDEAGYTVEDLTNITWQEYIEIGKDIKEATGKDMVTLDPNDLGQIRMMIQTVGSWYVEEDGSTPAIADNEALREAFEVYKGMMDADIVKLNSDWSQFVGAFNRGDVASIPTGNWITASVKSEESQSRDWAVVQIPRLSMDGSVNATNLGGSSWYVLNIDGKEKAADLLDNTFGANVELYEELVAELGAIGTYIPAIESDAYKAEDDLFGVQSIVADFSSWVDEIPSVNYGIHTYAIEDILVEGMQQYFNGKELTDVLNDAQTQADSQLK